MTATLGGSQLTGQLQALSAGESGTVKIPITTKPTPGTDTTLEVVVNPVPGRADHHQQHVHLLGRLRLLMAAANGSRLLASCGSLTSVRRGPSARTLSAARSADDEVEPIPSASVYDASGRARGCGRPRAGPLRELDRGRGHRHPRHARLRRRRPHARRRVRPPDPPLPDRPGSDPARANRGRPLPSAGERAVRPLHPREPPSGRGPRRSEHRRGGPDGRRIRPALGGARGRVRGAALRGRRVAIRAWRTRPTTSPASSGSPPTGRPLGTGPWRTSLVFSELGEDHPGALVDALQVLQPRRQPDAHRVAAAAAGSRPLPVLPRHRGRCRRRAVGLGIGDLRSKAETVRVLGSWPIAAPPRSAWNQLGARLQSPGNGQRGPRCRPGSGIDNGHEAAQRTATTCARRQRLAERQRQPPPAA